jgi:carbamoyl-phosphate synthase large subunit
MPALPDAAKVSELLPLLAGLGLVLAGLGWWAVARRRRGASRLLHEAVTDEDAGVRQAAVSLIGKEGLRRHAGMLLDLTQHESDPAVLRTIAETVSQNLWEPANDRSLVELRLWAQRHLREQPDEGSLRRPRGRAVAWEGPGAAPTVLVTGAGGAAGVAVIQALRERGVSTVGADADELATGMRLADCSGAIPRCDDPSFLEDLLKLADQSGANVLVSTVTEEMVLLNEATDELGAAGLAIWLSPATTIETCADKWRFAQAVAQSDVAVPPTALGVTPSVPGPWIVKPRFGRGSRHVHAVDETLDLAFLQHRVPDPIVQTRLHGMEFTVDALMDRDGTLAAAVPRWRLETKAGISSKGRTFRDEELVQSVEALLRSLGLSGSANVQGFVTAEEGKAVFVEVNPRFSGGLPLSLAAGADLVGEYLRGVLGMPIRRDRLRYRSGVLMTRYFENVFEQ